MSFPVLPCSRYISRLVAVQPELARELARDALWPLTSTEISQWLENPTSPQVALAEATLKPALRHVKQRALTRIAARDLLHNATLGEVVAAVSSVAEVCVASALKVIDSGMQQIYGTPRNANGVAQELIVIAMGKLGGRELNVSSDIDLIFVYPEDGESDGGRSISNFEYFTRQGRKLINAIADLTEDGQVFRVDMRLRPNGDSGPLVCSFDMLENYFLTQGREWERYAWIKARPITGSPDNADALEHIRRPFVFRKYLDFGAIEAMRGLHAQIRSEVQKKDMAGNIKLGPGGIREIEFIAQVFQLIRGGRDRGLQIRPTLNALNLLAESRQIPSAVVVELSAAYNFLRRLEHRLQYLDDAQTQTLPTAPEDALIIAQAMGFEEYSDLICALDQHRCQVSQHFAAIFAEQTQQDLATTPLAAVTKIDAATLTQMGYADGPALVQRIQAVCEGARFQQLSATARQRFDALLPRTIKAAAQTPQPDASLVRSIDLFEAVARRSAYLSLLLEYPQALQHLVRIAGNSNWAAEFLQQHPVLLDELLDPRLLEAAPDWAQFTSELEARLNEVEPDTERQMDIMREAHHAQVFRFLAQDVGGALPLERLSDHLSELADIMLRTSLTRVWRKLPQQHLPSPRFAIISYGKLGGKELGYASDLDLIFLFDDEHPDAAQIYSRLATRLNTWLSMRTAAGLLFETDLRLRPNGESGLVVTSFSAYKNYQQQSAWLWEHQALTRARFAAGDATIGAAFEALRIELLRQPRDLITLQREIILMRQKMYDAHAEKSADFNLKHDPGGLIDVEFLVQYLVLGYAKEYPDLTGNLGNIALLRLAATYGLIPEDLANKVRQAYRHYRKLQHSERLDNRLGVVAPELVRNDIAAVKHLWQLVFDSQ